MCGIVGAFDLKGNRLFPRELLQRMSAVLSHRGPDAEGVLSEPGYAASVKRLILRDPATGAQPMSDGEASICLNGELFSFSRDRLRLSRAGIAFHTASDTEVFLKGLQHEGLEFLANADAQFALAYRRKRDLTLARDSCGIAPLFYAEVDGWILFASEAKAILQSGFIRPALNHLAIDHMLTQLALAPGESCFLGIHALKPGHYFRVSNGKITSGAFGPPTHTNRQSEPSGDPARQIDRLDELLLDSVTRRLEADAPVGLYLSGGVDSSLIAAMSARVAKSQLTAYSVRLTTNGPDQDESSFAIATAARLGLNHQVLPVTPADLIENFPRAVLAAEMPVLDHANVCLLLLARLVHSDAKKAILTGEGADEAFGGYPWHLLSRGMLRRFADWIAYNVSSDLTRHTTRPFLGLNQYLLFAGLASVRNLFYSTRFREEILDSSDNSYQFQAKPAGRYSRLQRSLAFDHDWLLAGHLLADKGDRVSMLSSVEARYPFLDRDLKQMASGLLDNMKLRSCANKWILRKVAERYLPRKAAWRRKHLFRAEPVIHSAARPPWVNQLLSTESLRQTGLFDPELVQKQMLLRENPRRLPGNPFRDVGLSGVVSSQLLYHLFCGGGLCDMPEMKGFSTGILTNRQLEP
ncbi:MAG: asparagine synthase (glutamine-hydrolyzing) [Leptospirales bacterium]|nr:asparagine synthase (glutamine-hydrolyzing) [Leptospirales bacterium]